MTTVSDQAQTDAERRVEEHVARVAQLADDRGRADLSLRLRTELGGVRKPFATVVVAGEPKKGKSSLVNALVERPGLVPVDSDVATNARIVLHYSEREFARVLRENHEPHEIPIGELDQWASTAGNPHNEKGVQVVEVGLSHPMLEAGLVLVDTPGVGGLDAAHAEITLSALASADALMFVLDGSAPLTEPELDFLHRATGRIDTVVFALAKRDLYGGWRQTLAENRTLIAAYAPRWKDTPMIAVSSRAGLRAHAYHTTGQMELAQRFLKESGLDDLKAVVVDRVVARARVVRQRNALQLSHSALVEMARADAAGLSAAEGDAGLDAALREATQRRENFLKSKRVGGVALADDFLLLSQDLTREFNREVNELRVQYDRAIRANELKPEDVIENLDTDLRAILGRLDRELNRKLLELLDRLMREMRVELHPAQGALRAQSSLSGELSVGPNPGGFAQISTIMPSIFPAVGLASIGATVGSFLGVAAVTGGIGVVAGLALVPVTLVHRRRVRDQQEAQNLVRTGLDRAKTEVPPLLSENVLRMRRAVEQDMQSEIERREHELAQAVEDRQRLLRSELAKRERAKTDAQGRLDELKALRQQADELYRLIDVERSA